MTTMADGPSTICGSSNVRQTPCQCILTQIAAGFPRLHHAVRQWLSDDRLRQCRSPSWSRSAPLAGCCCAIWSVTQPFQHRHARDGLNLGRHAQPSARRRRRRPAFGHVFCLESLPDLPRQLDLRASISRSLELRTKGGAQWTVVLHGGMGRSPSTISREDPPQGR